MPIKEPQLLEEHIASGLDKVDDFAKAYQAVDGTIACSPDLTDGESKECGVADEQIDLARDEGIEYFERNSAVRFRTSDWQEQSRSEIPERIIERTKLESEIADVALKYIYCEINARQFSSEIDKSLSSIREHDLLSTHDKFDLRNQAKGAIRCVNLLEHKRKTEGFMDRSWQESIREESGDSPKLPK